jgi:O-methyltransferase involved in polyketide biosynthesis
LGEVQRTLLIPLWGRAQEFEKPDPLIKDPFAHEVLEKLDYDFSRMSEHMPDEARINCALRARHFDAALKELIAKHPDATVINIGAGLDTTFKRVDNGRIFWYDLDLPDSMALRRQLLPDGPRNVSIAKSVFDRSWFQDVKVRGSRVFLMAGGVFVYLNERDIKALFLDLAEEFPGCEIMFEIYSKLLVWLRNNVLVRKEMKSSDVMSRFKWGVGSAGAIARWSGKIRVVDEFPFYSRFDMEKNWTKEETQRFKAMNFFNWIKVARLSLG